MVSRPLASAFTAALAFLCTFQQAAAQSSTTSSSSSSATQWVTTTDADGNTIYLADNRKPALYTGNFGDCLGNSLVNVTRFDAAYYQDNMTVLFHLAGNTGLVSEDLMMYIGVYAYGESRFDLTFNPCNANIDSLCPMNSTVPIEANGIIPVAQSDVANIPPIAFNIPDFEGEAILRIFANSTQSEIGCYSAVVTNGHSFSQPSSVGTVLGLFTLVALVASFATAIYGDSLPVMRTHYAHSLSVGVVFAVFQHIFFTGALSMNWPSVLVAWWSNFAWSSGMIYSSTMQASINHLIGNNIGNTSQVGAASAGTTQESLGGGYNIQSIYGRSLSHVFKRDIASEIYNANPAELLKRDIVSRSLEQTLQRRDLANSSSGYTWYGSPVGTGIPLPGNYSGFAGTLAQENIRVSNAFMTGFLWFIIFLVLMVASVIAFKWVVEGLVRIKALRQDRLSLFRQNWLRYTAMAALRICYLGFFMMMLLTMFEFSYGSSGGVKAIAALVFIVFFVGVPMCVLYAYLYRAQQIKYAGSPDSEQTADRKLCLNKSTLGLLVPNMAHGQNKRLSLSGPFQRWAELGKEPVHIHEDEEYLRRFGWLSARFRRSRWWFFGFWTFYEFIRACFYAGASGHPLTQVFGLLVVEIFAFAFVVWARPFEGSRLNILVVYLLGFSKVTTIALSAAFDINFNLARITTTAIGIIIIVIQGILTIVTMIAIVIGAISSYMSMTRNHEEFKPKKWVPYREKYFAHLERTAHEIPRPRPAPPPEPEEPKGPYFNVSSVRRMQKIEDDDPVFGNQLRQDPSASHLSLNSRSATPTANRAMSGGDYPPSGRRSRAISGASASRTSLPFGARTHRPSWSTRDFLEDQNDDAAYMPIDMNQSVPEDVISRSTSPAPGPSSNIRSKKSTRSSTMPASTPLPKLRPMQSMDSIKIGGEVSTPDTIGKVPMPVLRPRSGTWSSRVPSRAPSRAGTPTPSVYHDTDTFSPTQRGGLSVPEEVPGESKGQAALTPNEEREEDLMHQLRAAAQ